MDTADEILRNDNVRITLETAFSFYDNDNMVILSSGSSNQFVSPTSTLYAYIKCDWHIFWPLSINIFLKFNWDKSKNKFTILNDKMTIDHYLGIQLSWLCVKKKLAPTKPEELGRITYLFSSQRCPTIWTWFGGWIIAWWLSVVNAWGPFLLTWLTFIPAWISNCIQVWEWIGYFIQHFPGHLITYFCWD